jgi:hypothetical protein
MKDIDDYTVDYIELLKEYKSALDDYNKSGLLIDEERAK